MILRIHNSERGFSLVELTVVLLLITLLASVAVRETSELGFQTRYEQTRERLDMIRQAILGNPRQIINGQQAVNGFVADMGRLPMSVRELIDISAGSTGYCGDKTYVDQATCEGNHRVWFSLCSNSTYTDQQTCETNNALWMGRKSFGFCSDASYQNNQTLCLANGKQWAHLFYGGWNGPYISVSENPAEPDALTDGWGNQATAVTDQSYGWSFFQLDTLTGNTQDSGNLIIQSFGKNQKKDNAIPTNTDYENDFPPNLNLFNTVYFPNPAVLRQDWLVDISGGIGVNFAKRFGANAHCGFLDANKASLTTQQKCENAGGNWSGSACTAIDETSCKSVGGNWQSCFFSPATCVVAGGTSITECQFSKKSCIAAAGNTLAWDATNHICTISSNSTYCANAGGSWSGTACSFSTNSCSLAGGAWDQDCAFTQASCTTAGGTWQNIIKPDSCAFSQANCTLKNGVSNGSDCYMSHAEATGARYDANSCQGASGKWTGRICMNVFYRDALTMTIKTASSDPVVVDENGAFSTQMFTGFKNGGTPVNSVPTGQNAIGIYEYDGDCDPVNNPLYPADRQNPIQIDFHTHTTLPTINW